MEAEPELEKDEGGLLKQIQTILYSTEVGSFSDADYDGRKLTDILLQEGFEIPAEADDEEGELIEEETF